MIRAIFFDIGSTLVTGPGVGVASRIASKLGLTEFQKEKINWALMTRPFYSAVEAATYLRNELGVAAGGVEHIVDEVWRAQLYEAHVIDGAVECVQSWANAGADICLISNIWRPYQMSAIEALGPALQSIIPVERRLYSYAAGAAKPEPAIFLKALQLVGCEPSEAVMIGDSYREDIAPSAALGLKTVWVLRRAEREIANLTSVLNHQTVAPDMAVASVADFTVEKWRNFDLKSQSALRATQKEM